MPPSRHKASKLTADVSSVAESDVRLVWVVLHRQLYLWLQSSWAPFFFELLSFTLNTSLVLLSPLVFPRDAASSAFLRVCVSTAWFKANFQRLYFRVGFELLHEKNSKLRLYQEVNGLHGRLYWLCWFVWALALSMSWAFIFAVASVIASQFGGLFEHSNPFLVFVVVALAYLQYSLLAWPFAVIFESAESFSHMGLVWFVPLGVAIALNLTSNSWTLYCIAQLVPLVSVYTSLGSIQWLEVAGTGLSFRTLFTDCCSPGRPLFNGQYFPVGLCMVFMAANITMYGLLAYWLDQRHQGRCGGGHAEKRELAQGYEVSHPLAPEANTGYGTSTSHQEASGEAAAVQITDVVKRFGKTLALDHLSLTVRPGEIFALLGHNGAGKTTLIHCLCGMTLPTCGSMSVHGVSAIEAPEAVRQLLALCPQESPIFELLTVEKHLEFFASLRAIEASRLPEEVARVIKLLGLEEKRMQLGQSLSGGQRRRLWVATSLLGSPRVVLLDEPTSGMDPASRQQLWDVLNVVRGEGRTVVFTTHYLDEADIMADRKAILAEGQVKAIGTSLDLKKRYAVGYRLRIDFAADAVTHSTNARETVFRHVPAAKETHAPSPQAQPLTLAFSVPFSDVDLLGPLLSEIDKRSKEWQIQDYGLQMSSLEDVFLQFAPASVAGSESADVAPYVDPSPAAPASPQARAVAGGSLLDAKFGRFAASPTRILLGQARALAEVRIRVVLDNGSFSVLFKILLPIILIDLWMLRNRHNASPSGWYTLAVGFPISLGTVTGPTLRELYLELVRKRKHLMLSQGLSGKAYWLASLVADYVLILPVVLSIPIMGCLFQMPYISGPGMALIVVECFVFPLNLMVFLYTLATYFAVGEARMERMNALLQWLGTLLGTLLPSVLVLGILVMACAADQPRRARLMEAAHRVHFIVSLVSPTYAMSGVLLFVLAESWLLTEGDLERPVPRSPMAFFGSPAAWPLYLSPIVTGLLIVRLIHNSGAQQQGSEPAPSTEPERTQAIQDIGVASEEERLEREGAFSEDVVVYRNLRYTYQHPKAGLAVEAVRGISLGLRRGECFGLLGPNGAGKTTTLSCVTGELWPPASGSVVADGRDLAREGFGILYKQLGVCPQSDDHLWPALTGRQHLNLYCSVKGLRPEDVDNEVALALSRVDLPNADADRQTSEYSGGMRRRLSVAIALLGQPRVLFLDEPSVAVDALAKRRLWAAIKSRGPQQTVLLTSHQMEEVEALADRVAVQVLGRLRCLGSPSELRHRYGRGYQLELLFDPADPRHRADDAQSGATGALLEKFVREHISQEVEVLASRPGRALFQVLAPACEAASHLRRLAAMFTEVARARKDLGILDYSIRQPTLEQVFVRLAQEQADSKDKVW